MMTDASHNYRSHTRDSQQTRDSSGYTSTRSTPRNSSYISVELLNTPSVARFSVDEAHYKAPTHRSLATKQRSHHINSPPCLRRLRPSVGAQRKPTTLQSAAVPPHGQAAAEASPGMNMRI